MFKIIFIVLLSLFANISNAQTQLSSEQCADNLTVSVVKKGNIDAAQLIVSMPDSTQIDTDEIDKSAQRLL
jgi:uncharacterized membrane protein affecting hemolysin expression